MKNCRFNINYIKLKKFFGVILIYSSALVSFAFGDEALDHGEHLSWERLLPPYFSITRSAYKRSVGEGDNAFWSKKENIELAVYQSLFSYWVYTEKMKFKRSLLFEKELILLYDMMKDQESFRSLVDKPTTAYKGDNFIGVYYEIPIGAAGIARYEIDDEDDFDIENRKFRAFLSSLSDP
jgi:hypothetical protein